MDITKSDLNEVLDNFAKKIKKEEGEVKISLSQYHGLLYYKEQYKLYVEKIQQIDKIVCRILNQECDVKEYPYNNIFKIREIICK